MTNIFDPKYSYAVYAVMKHQCDNKAFLDWTYAIELKVFKELGVYLLDLPDEAYYTHYENGVSANSMANHIMIVQIA